MEEDPISPEWTEHERLLLVMRIASEMIADPSPVWNPARMRVLGVRLWALASGGRDALEKFRPMVVSGDWRALTTHAW
jgi:hypothetical protein